VIQLAKGLTAQGHHIYADNLFMMPGTVRDDAALGHGMCGTWRANDFISAAHARSSPAVVSALKEKGAVNLFRDFETQTGAAKCHGAGVSPFRTFSVLVCHSENEPRLPNRALSRHIKQPQGRSPRCSPVARVPATSTRAVGTFTRGLLHRVLVQAPPRISTTTPPRHSHPPLSRSSSTRLRHSPRLQR